MVNSISFDNCSNNRSLVSNKSFALVVAPALFNLAFTFSNSVDNKFTLSKTRLVWVKAPLCVWFNLAELSLKAFDKSLPASIATVLGAESSGAAPISCNELKNLPIKVLKSLPCGNKSFSRIFTSVENCFICSYEECADLSLSVIYSLKDLLISSTRTPRPDWSETSVTPPWTPPISSNATSLLEYPSVFTFAIFCPVTAKACL